MNWLEAEIRAQQIRNYAEFIYRLAIFAAMVKFIFWGLT